MPLLQLLCNLVDNRIFFTLMVTKAFPQPNAAPSILLHTTYFQLEGRLPTSWANVDPLGERRVAVRGQLPPGADRGPPLGRRAPQLCLRARGGRRALREERAGVAQAEPGAANETPGGHAQANDSAAH